jgi:hypothetical protein
MDRLLTRVPFGIKLLGSIDQFGGDVRANLAREVISGNSIETSDNRTNLWPKGYKGHLQNWVVICQGEVEVSDILPYGL